MHYVVRTLLIWLLCLLSVLLHELGHALGFRIATGKTGWKVIAGSGPEILNTPKFTFCLLPIGGCFVPAEELKTKKARLMTLAGGPFVSLLLTFLFFFICRFCVYGSTKLGSELYEGLLPVFDFVFYFNFFQLLFTAIPMHYRIVCRGLESDGLQIAHVLKSDKA